MRKNDYTIFLLVAAGLGIWWYMRKKTTSTTVNPADQNKKIEIPDMRVAYDPVPQDFLNRLNNVAPDTSNVQVQKTDTETNVHFQINGYKKRLGNVPNTI